MPEPPELVLPDLEPAEITAGNIRAAQTIYAAAQLEATRIFDVVDLLVQRAMEGLLPLDDGDSRIVRSYVRRRGERLTADERRSVYERTFGAPGGDTTEPSGNREFAGLWVRFLSAVDAFARQVEQGIEPSLDQSGLIGAGRDLARNASLHGYGIGYFAALELQQEVRDALAILSLPSVLRAFGASSLWQVIDHVSVTDLGGSPNVRRHRALAVSGAVVLCWLADRAPALASAAAAPIVGPDAIQQPPSANPTASPNDRDLVDACRQWLASISIA